MGKTIKKNSRDHKESTGSCRERDNVTDEEDDLAEENSVNLVVLDEVSAASHTKGFCKCYIRLGLCLEKFQGLRLGHKDFSSPFIIAKIIAGEGVRVLQPYVPIGHCPHRQ